MPPDLAFVCAQPKLLYYAWQLEVMLRNFIESGVDPGSIEVLLAVSTDPNSETNSRDTRDLFERMRSAFPSVVFSEYADTRPDGTAYVSSVRPHLIAKHMEARPDLATVPILYHDCDIIFTRPPDLRHLLVGGACYASDASGYIGAGYLRSRGPGVYEAMCRVVGIDPAVPEANQAATGGAQYVLKGTTPAFWRKVESDCVRLYDHLASQEPTRLAADPGRAPVQKWTSDMWALLWNLWLHGMEVRTDPSLDFCWATDPLSALSAPIMHNAGVTGPGRHFCKHEYTRRLPYGEPDRFDPGYCSHHYFEQVRRVGRDSCLR